MNDAKIIPLQQLYLSIIVTTVGAEGLDSVQQDLGADAGRLWLVRKGTTVPQAWVGYKFDVESVKIGIQTRDERELTRTVKYAEGIDGFAEELSRFLRANRLTHKRAA